MNKALSSILEKLALVSVTAAVSSAIVLHQQGDTLDPSIPQTLRAHSLEIVDMQGRPCVVLKAGKMGGTFEVFSPSKGSAKNGQIAYLGSVFGEDTQFVLKEAKAGGKAGMGMFIGGEPSYPRIGGVGGSGQSHFSLGGIGNGAPMLRLWKLNEKEPYHER